MKKISLVLLVLVSVFFFSEILSTSTTNDDIKWGIWGDRTGLFLRAIVLPLLAQEIVALLPDAPQDMVDNLRDRLEKTGCLGASNLKVKFISSPHLGPAFAIRMAFGFIPVVILNLSSWGELNERQQYMVLNHEFGHLYYFDALAKIACGSFMALGGLRFERALSDIFLNSKSSLSICKDKGELLKVLRDKMESNFGLKKCFTLADKMRQTYLLKFFEHKVKVVLDVEKVASRSDAAFLFLGKMALGFWGAHRWWGKPFGDFLERDREHRADSFAIKYARNAYDLIEMANFFERIDKSLTTFIKNNFVSNYIRLIKRSLDPVHPLLEDRVKFFRDAAI